MAFKNAYRTPYTPVEQRHLDLYSGYCLEFKQDHARLVTERMIKQTTLTGTGEEIRARIAKMAALGVRQVAIAGGRSVVADFSSDVIHQIR